MAKTKAQREAYQRYRRAYIRDKMAIHRAKTGKGRRLDAPPPPPIPSRSDDPKTFPEPDQVLLRGPAKLVWEMLCRIKRFNLNPNEFHFQSLEVQGLIRTARATEEQLRALEKFYALSEDSRRKATVRGLMANFQAQIDLALE